MENIAQQENRTNHNKNEELIAEIISSLEFRNRLSVISSNYSNLKQENVIRNYILEKLNEKFVKIGFDHKKAFAEHPRINDSRVDLSIIDTNELNNPFKIEFKYQFSGDNKHMKDYARIIRKDFNDRDSDLFILIIGHWKKADKKEFDDKWGITSNLSRFISNKDQWKTGIKLAFDQTENSILKEFTNIENAELIEYEKIKIEFPFNMEYYFYVLKKQQDKK